MNDAAQTSARMRKPYIDDDNDLSLDARVSDRRVRERAGVIQETEVNVRSTQMLKDHGESYESLRKVDSRARYHNGQGQRSEEMTGDSQQSGISFRSATTEEMLDKYEITSIMKRKRQEQKNKHKKFKQVAKVLLVILLFPLSLVWLLIAWIIDKKQQKRQQQHSNSSNASQPSANRSRRPQQSTCCDNCIDSIQDCCSNFFCYYLCCECCSQCRWCTKCCRRFQKCLQCLCENSLVEGVENFMYCCFVRNCEKFWKCVCCHRRSHQRLDTMERLDKMNRQGGKRRLEID